MSERYLEITNQTMVDLGFYSKPDDGLIPIKIIEWHVRVGDDIPGVQDPDTGTLRGGLIVSLESEKGETEFTAAPSDVGARVKEILIEAGETVERNFFRGETLRLAILEVDGEAVAKEIKAVRPPPDAPQSFAEAMDRQQVRHMIRTSPYARRLAKAHNIDLGALEGSGPGGRIHAKDVEARIAPQPSSEAPPMLKSVEPAGLRIIKPSMRRLATARNLEKMALRPLVSIRIAIRAEPLEELRGGMRDEFKRLHGTDLRFDHFVGMASAWLLQQPEFSILNAFWREEEKDIACYPWVHLGFAVGIPSAQAENEYRQSELVVVSVKNAERLGFVAFAREANRLMEAAVAGTSAPYDFAGTTFTVNNTGSPVEWRGKRYAGDECPHSIPATGTSAILSFGAIHEEGDARKMNIVLCFDHGVSDGYEPKVFLRVLQELLEHPEQILAL